MTDRRARVLIFTGRGKGKTTAALGMALRAAGHGMRVHIIQFVKGDDDVGEVAAIRDLPGVSLEQTGLGFLPDPTSPAFAEHVRAARDGLVRAAAAIEAGEADMLILDEICFAVAKGLLDEEEVCDLIAAAGPQMCLVLTGQDAPPALIDTADTVTEMRCIKHGMDAGLPAQDGVER